MRYPPISYANIENLVLPSGCRPYVLEAGQVRDNPPEADQNQMSWGSGILEYWPALARFVVNCFLWIIAWIIVKKWTHYDSVWARENWVWRNEIYFYMDDTDQKLKSGHHPLFIPNIPIYLSEP
jgi:hypothetical protein